MQRRQEEDPSGHYQTAAMAIGAMSVLAFLLYFATVAFGLTVGFIDERGILGIGALFGIVALTLYLTSNES